ncbi:LPXTG cell wall anchor domain-containing protein [Listeria grandensis]|uniref:LPXTG cell wall anchor domain-containing protein n=1 Tax=Listeria grandensis TaxID=1494963 RepID=A0A7X1CP79_9LIST|nr:MucBP domain-containing protein [Listeria grandensis]MBC1935724.1 LPXTG cell wall anchor domain-containing protein [Listeria grandensis]
MKKFLKIFVVMILIFPFFTFVLEPKVVYAALEQRVEAAKNESKAELTENVKRIIQSNSEQRINTVTTPLTNKFSYKTGESTKYSEGGPTWKKEAYVISMNPIYTTVGVDTNLLSIDYKRPGDGTTKTDPSSISITAKTNKKIDTSFLLEVRSVYTVFHTLEREVFWGSSEQTLYSQDVLDKPISIRVHVTKANEEGAVKVSYTDVDTGKSIMNESVIHGKIGNSYNQDVQKDYTAKKEYIKNQHYKYVGEKNTTGSYRDGEINAEYQFEREQGGNVSVNHVNAESTLNDKQREAFGSPTPDILAGKYGDTVTAKAKKMAHYETIDGKEEMGIKLDEKPQQQSFKYKLKQAKPLTVKYVDEDGNTIPGVDNKIISGKWGDKYTVAPREEIPFYTLVDSSEKKEGYLTDDNQEIVYHYKVSEGAPIVIHYVDEKGKTIHPDKKLTGLNYGSKFKEQAINIDHYRQKKDEISGQVTDKQQEITFVYEKNDGKPVIVRFKDDKDRLIDESYLMYGKHDESFDGSEKNKAIQEILKKLKTDHYTLQEIQGNPHGKFTDDNDVKYSSELTYSLKKDDAPGQVKVRYINKNDQKEIATEEILTGKYEERYVTTPKFIKGYHLVDIPDNTSGTFSDTNSEVTYLYEPDIGGTVELHYIDKDTKEEISPVDVKNGGVNQAYNFAPKNINRYELSHIPDNATGTYPDPNQTIKVYYSYTKTKAKPVHVIYQDKEGKELAKEELDGNEKKWGDSFETELKSFTGYELKEITLNGVQVSEGIGVFDDTNEQTVVYSYDLKKAAPVKVQYIDDDTQKEISQQEEILDKNAIFGDLFESHTKDIPGYIFGSGDLNGQTQEGNSIVGNYTDQAQIITYHYKKDKTKIAVKDSIVYVGESWSASDNFESASDKNGDPIKFQSIQANGTVDVTKEGIYPIEYSYGGVKSTAYVTVKENKKSLPSPALDKDEEAFKDNKFTKKVTNIDDNKSAITSTKNKLNLAEHSVFDVKMQSKYNQSTVKKTKLPKTGEEMNKVAIVFGLLLVIISLISLYVRKCSKS